MGVKDRERERERERDKNGETIYIPYLAVELIASVGGTFAEV